MLNLTVVYTNQFTVSKFMRLAIQDGSESGLSAARHGFSLMPGQDRLDPPSEFEIRGWK